MPLTDGAALVTEVRANPVYRDIPVVMMNAAPESALREALDGHIAFLRKPFRIPVLLEGVRSTLEGACGSREDGAGTGAAT